MINEFPIWKRICSFYQIKNRLSIFGYCCYQSFFYNQITNIRHYVCVRFAPSPTGMLHLGGLRTLLYNYAFAFSQKGKFILRIEDTDQNRMVPGVMEKLYAILNWIGLPPDEGPLNGGEHGPYIQSQRLPLYKEKIKILIENKSAYYCFCTEHRLALLKKEAKKKRENFGYDNHCRFLTSEEVTEKLSAKVPYVIRLKIPSEMVTFEDLVHGPTKINLAELEGDPILMKSDGFPTYHFANVVDDHSMKITHVLRGMEWHTSTVKHILLYRAFGYEPPQFAHLPLLLNSDGSKLSKRQGSIGIDDFKNKGYYPEAILNFLASGGGGFKHEDMTVVPTEELLNSFCISHVVTRPSKVDLHHLDLYNRIHIQQQLMCSEGKKFLISELRSLILDKFKDVLSETELQKKILQDEYLGNVLDWSSTRIYKLHDLVTEDFQYLWVIPSTFNLTDLPVTNSQAAKILDNLHKSLKDKLSNLSSRKSLDEFFREFAEKNKMQYKTLMKLMRITLSNMKKGPGVIEMMDVLGRESALERVCYAQHWFLSNQPQAISA